MAGDILLSIKPIHADKIISGQKIFEYRRKIPAMTIEYIAIYSSSPVKKVTALAKVVNVVTESPAKLWDITHEGGAISKEAFDNYFNGLLIAHAFKFGQITKLISPIPLNIINKSIHPPQSFRYLSCNELQIIINQTKSQ
jgi:type I restriction enzyme S subunit